jgi:hypothetical protein
MDQWWRLQGEERRPQASPSLAATGHSLETITIQPHAHLMSTIGTDSSMTPSRRKVALLSVTVHWWKKGLPFDTFVSNQIRSATKGLISPGSFENVGQGALVPVQKGPSVPVSSNSRE